jgi:hypothetical protein
VEIETMENYYMIEKICIAKAVEEELHQVPVVLHHALI